VRSPARYLGLALCGGLLWTPVSAPASGLSDLLNAAGQGLPNVPEPPAPTPVGDSGTGSGNQNAQNDDSARQEALRQQRAEQERREKEEQERREKEEQARRDKEEQERRAKEEQERRAREEEARRLREEQARQERLRQQAAAARVQWAAADQQNSAAFDDIFNAPAGGGAAVGDPNVVDLSDATHLVPALLRGGAPRISLRSKPPPPPEAEVTSTSAGSEPEPPPRLPQWHPDWEQKLTDLGFAYASLYLKDKVDGLASLPELVKDSLDLKKKLNDHCTNYLGAIFSTATQAANPRANYAVLAAEAETHFQTFAANADEDARSGLRNNLATTSSGALPEGSGAAEVGIGLGQAQLQDVQELKKWGDANQSRHR